MAAKLDSTDRTRFQFQHRWFDEHIPEWETRTAQLREKKLRILEIGAFEGNSTTWILENLMSHPESSFTVIDTFLGSMEHQSHPDVDYKVETLEERFRSNVAKCEHSSKLEVLKQFSGDALAKLYARGARFDFIYVDASHTAWDVLRDGVLAWSMLEVGGTIVFDDYFWDRYEEPAYCPGIAIDALLQCVAPEAESSVSKKQMWSRKVPVHIQPTPNKNTDPVYWGFETKED